MSDLKKYDVLVIGGGPGGYVAAIRAAQNGLSVACIEGRGALGGTCLNVGCIPSKALLHAAHQYHEAIHNFPEIGIVLEQPKIDWKRMQAFKDDVVQSNVNGIAYLFKKNKIDYIQGWATIESVGKVRVGDTLYTAQNIIIATGSTPTSIPNVKIDERLVVSSTGALSLSKIPEKLVVVGAGVIGLELGSVYKRLGAEVTVIEFLDHITPGMDREMGKQLQRVLQKQGFELILNAAVTGVDTSKSKAKITYQDRNSAKEAHIDADVVLVATGRKAFTEGLGLDQLGVEVNERGQIKTNAHWQTNIAGIYAIGDVIEGPMLAHKAEDEGMACADFIAGRVGHVNYDVIPGVIYTTPEVSSVGQTEEMLKAAGIPYKVGKFNFKGNGRAKAAQSSEGLVKILAHAETDRILGAHILGPQAGEMIHEFVVAMEFGAAAEDIARSCHAHPTFSEAIREAALDLGGGAIHA